MLVQNPGTTLWGFFVFVFLAHATWFQDLSSPYQELNQGQSSESLEVTGEIPKQLCS